LEKFFIDLFDIINDSILEETHILENVENNEISINYVMNKIIWNKKRSRH